MQIEQKEKTVERAKRTTTNYSHVETAIHGFDAVVAT